MSRLGSVFFGIALAATAVLTPQIVGAQQPAAAAAKPIQWMTLGQVAKVEPKTDVYLKSTVLSLSTPAAGGKAPYIVYLKDESGTGKLVIFQDIWATIPDTSILEPGNVLQIFGQADDYRGERQVELRKANHVRRAPGTAAPAPSAAGSAPAAAAGGGDGTYKDIMIGDIGLNTIGQTVHVLGTVKKIDRPKADRVPYKVKLQDNTGEVELVYWDDTAEELAPNDRPKVGKLIQVSGKVTEHKGKIQLRVDKKGLIKSGT